MAHQVFTNCTILLAGFDLSGDSNAVALTYAAELQDNTTFGSTTRTRMGGLASVVGQIEGLWDADGTDEPHDAIFSRIGTANVPITIAPNDGAAGEVAFILRSIAGEHSVGGSIGDLLPYSVSFEGSGGAPLVEGTVLRNSTETATGTGDDFVLGAASSGERVYGALHVIGDPSGTSPTLDVVVQSDVDDTFASPVTVLTFGQMTARGSDWQSAAGPNTDTYYRVSFTLGGTTPSFRFVVVVGIK